MSDPTRRLGGRYKLERVLGEGGFAVVYLAIDEQSGQKVAAKVLKDPGADRETALRFDRELAIVGSLRSEHSVALLDRGTTEDGELFAIFEYVDGEDLDDVLQRHGQLEGMVVMRIMRQLLEVLAEAHARGLLHRDIKPQNIRVLGKGDDPWQVKLLDWGIARIDDTAHPRVTATGIVLGTPRYMSPEQLRGKPLTPASDIYSLGLVGIEMLVGSDALCANSVSHQLDRLVTGHVVNIPLRDPDDAALAIALTRFTTVHPQERVATAVAALRALDALQYSAIDDTRVRTARVMPRRSDKVAARKDARWLAVATIALAALALWAAVSVWTGTKDAPRVEPIQNTRPTRPTAMAVESTAPTPTSTADASTADVGAASDARGSVSIPSYGSHGCGIAHEMGAPDDVYLYPPSGVRNRSPMPLLLVVHDKWDDLASFVRGSGIVDLADHEQLLVAGLPGRHVWRPEDASRFEDLINRVGRIRCVDRRRVYVLANRTGYRVSQTLSCSQHVTAVASNAQFIPINYEELRYWPPTCESDPRPLMHLTPLDSPRFPLDGSVPCDSKNPRVTFEEFEELHGTFRGCDMKRKPLTYSTHAEGECRTWNCDAQLVSCRYRGGSHYPGVTAPPAALVAQKLQVHKCSAERSTKFPITQTAWRFFSESPPLKL